MKKTKIISALMALAIVATPAMGIASNGISNTGSHRLTAYAYSKNVKGIWIQDANNKKWWYRHDDGTYTKNDWELIEGKYYLFDKDGWMLTGLKRFSGDLYYLHPDKGYMLTDWRKINGYWYYFDNTSGKALTKWQFINGKWYYFDKQSCRAYEDIHTIDGKGYYFRFGSAEMFDDGEFSLYRSNKDWEGFRDYYAYSDGHLASGVTYVRGQRRYYHPTMYYRVW